VFVKNIPSSTEQNIIQRLRESGENLILSGIMCPVPEEF